LLIDSTPLILWRLVTLKLINVINIYQMTSALKVKSFLFNIRK